MLLREGSPGELCPRDGSNRKVIRPFETDHLVSADQILVTVMETLGYEYCLYSIRRWSFNLRLIFKNNLYLNDLFSFLNNTKLYEYNYI